MYHIHYAIISGTPIVASLIVASFLLFFLVLCCCRCLRKEVADFAGTIASKVFPEILSRTEGGTFRWRFFNIDFTDMIYRDCLLLTMFAVTVLLVGLIGLVFWRTLFLEVSYYCDLEDPEKECFKLRGTVDPFLHPWDKPVDCAKAVLEDIPVICYRFQFDVSAAACSAFGTYKLFSVLLILMSWLILQGGCMTKCVKGFQVVTVFLLKISMLALMVLLFLVLIRLTFVQLLVMGAMFAAFILMPWVELIALKKSTNSEDSLIFSNPGRSRDRMN